MTTRNVLWQWRHHYVMGRYINNLAVYSLPARKVGFWRAGGAPQYPAFVKIGG